MISWKLEHTWHKTLFGFLVIEERESTIAMRVKSSWACWYDVQVSFT